MWLSFLSGMGVKMQPIERVHLAVILRGKTGRNRNHVEVSSSLAKPLQVHIFAEDQLLDSFKGIVSI